MDPGVASRAAVPGCGAGVGAGAAHKVVEHRSVVSRPAAVLAAATRDARRSRPPTVQGRSHRPARRRDRVPPADRAEHDFGCVISDLSKIPFGIMA